MFKPWLLRMEKLALTVLAKRSSSPTPFITSHLERNRLLGLSPNQLQDEITDLVTQRYRLRREAQGNWTAESLAAHQQIQNGIFTRQHYMPTEPHTLKTAPQFGASAMRYMK
jgi:hypothetical protein